MNLKKKIMFGIFSVLLMIPAISTKAITKEELQKKVAPNNKVEMTTVKPYESYDLSSFSSIHFNSILGYGSHYVVLENCNTDYSKCDINYKDYSTQEQITIENVIVTWQKEKLNKTELQKVLAPNNKVESTTIKPTEIYDLSNFSSTHFQNSFDYDAYITLENCNDNYSKCNIRYEDYKTREKVIIENVEVTWQDAKLNKTELQKVLAPNNKLSSTTVKPYNSSDLSSFSSTHFENIFGYDSYTYITLENCNDDYSKCDIRYEDYKTREKVIIENVEVIWQDAKINKDELKKVLAPNNKIEMTTVKPTESYELYGNSYTHFENNFEYYATIILENCNDDYSKCNIKYQDSKTEEKVIIENVEVTWQDTKLNKDEIQNKVVPNGILKMNSVRPKDEEELYIIQGAVFGRFGLSVNEGLYISNCNDDYSVCEIKYTDKNTLETLTLKNIKMEWQESNAEAEREINKNLNDIINIFKSNNDLKMEDLEVIKLYNSTNEAIDITKKLGSSYLDKNISFTIASQGYGVPSKFTIVLDGWLVIAYNNVFYNIQKNDPFYLTINNIIYIPDDTKDTNEAYMKAAYERLQQIDKNIKIEAVGKLSDVYSSRENLISKEDLNNYYYRISNNKFSQLFIIKKDSSKMQTIDSTGEIEEPATEVGKDEETGITIETTSKEVPSDSKIIVKVIEKTDDIFKKIINKIKAKVEEVMVIDLKVYSESKDKYISEVLDGEFIVNVPLIDELKNKNLVAYYIKDNGDVEEHPVTVKDGIATFRTTHFSTYTIAEKKVEDVPLTYDGIMRYVAMLLIGIIGIGATSLMQKTKKNER